MPTTITLKDVLIWGGAVGATLYIISRKMQGLPILPKVLPSREEYLKWYNNTMPWEIEADIKAQMDKIAAQQAKVTNALFWWEKLVNEVKMLGGAIDQSEHWRKAFQKWYVYGWINREGSFNTPIVCAWRERISPTTPCANGVKYIDKLLDTAIANSFPGPTALTMKKQLTQQLLLL